MFFATWETCIWSFLEFVLPGCWHFDNGATSKIERGGLLHVLPLDVHLRFFLQDHCETFLLFEFFFVGPLLHY